VVNEPAAVRAASSVVDECRRLAELLRLDVVGVMTTAGGKRRVELWTDPNGPALPPRLDDALDGRAEGWIVCPIPGGDAAVFARTTDRSTEQADAVLRAVGPSLAAEVSGAVPLPSHPNLLVLAHGVTEESDRRPGQDREPTLDHALATIRNETGFDTITLFQSHPGTGWRVGRRVGPVRAWHSVLDPGVAGAATGGELFHDVRAIPGTGERLAAMGCGSIGVLTLPHGARLVLDSSLSRPSREGWRNLSPEHVETVAALLSRWEAHPGTAGTAAPDPETELDAIERVSEGIRRALEDPRTDGPALLAAVAGAMGADEVCHLVERGGELDILSHPASEWPRRFPREVRSALRALPAQGPLDEATARQLGVVLGLSSTHLAAAFAGDASLQEALVAGWRDGPGLSPRAMRTVVHLAGAARAGIDARRNAVDSLMVRERNRWASEIHDGLTQLVTTAVLELEAMGRRIEEDPQGAIETLTATKAEIRKSLSELRVVLFDLSRDGGSVGRSSSLAPLERFVNDVVERWKLRARVTVQGDLPALPRAVVATAYVVIRESLANAAKHAAPASVSVNVRATSDEVIVEVGDTGRGFVAFGAPSRTRAGGHFGLDMMKRRVAEVGGSLDVESTPGAGTRVVARLPVRGEEP